MFGQSQNGQNNLQAGRDINQGVSQSQIKEIVQELLDVVYNPTVKLIVSEYMLQNMKQFSESLLNIIDSETLSNKIIKNPDLAFIIDKTIKIVGEKGNRLDLDVLLKLLIERINSNENSLITIVTEQAIEKADKITQKHIALLTIIQIMQNIKYTKESLNDLAATFKEFIPLIKESFDISNSNKKYLSSLGLVEINLLEGDNTYDKFYDTYQSLLPNLEKENFTKEIEKKYSDIYLTLTTYKKNSLYQMHPTTVGEMIALANLKKIYKDIDMKTWIK